MAASDLQASETVVSTSDMSGSDPGHGRFGRVRIDAGVSSSAVSGSDPAPGGRDGFEPYLRMPYFWAQSLTTE